MSTPTTRLIYHADTAQKPMARDVQGEYVTLLGEPYYCIRNYDALEPFFMTLVSSSNHWLYIASTGGLSAGRVNADHALFPYYTVDKITENSEHTGAKAIFLVMNGAGSHLWEPFSERYHGIYHIERNLYKNIAGTALVFEEINHDLNLSYRYAWRTSEAYGFVKTSWLINHSNRPCTVEILDGLQNILPAHVDSGIQNVLSNLLDAYKISELDPATGLGMFSLSSRLSDLPEPGESLRTNTVWQTGLHDVTHLLSSTQVERFRCGESIAAETRICGQRGAYFVRATVTLAPESDRRWHLVADIDQDSADVTALRSTLVNNIDSLYDVVEDDIRQNQRNLETIVGCADGLQVSNDTLSTAHHFANVLFNVMRGGIFANQYHVDTADLRDYVRVHKPILLREEADFFASLPPSITVTDLRQRVDKTDSVDLIRHCYNYLPLTFSRRHGDPSRPWNRFEINVKKANGDQMLDYQGNWRDIFQNWEALSYSYPEFIDGMISVFLSATTCDGYNPYRLTRNGVDWEIPEPSNAWANIGYWNDHQIIYLQKLLEVCHQFYPGKLTSLLSRRIFSAANVPYRIKAYADLVKNPYRTIVFDWDEENRIKARVKQQGADGKLVLDSDGQVFHVAMGEKLLLLLLTKLANFVPEGGIWLNTQRPEWNDANNALVGKGLSVVTLGYLRRYIAFFIDLLQASQLQTLTLSTDLYSLFDELQRILNAHHALLSDAINDTQRRAIMDRLGRAGSVYRWQYYTQGAAGTFTEVSAATVINFLHVAQDYVEHSLRANKRPDNLYHAYNTLHLTDNSATIRHLPEMLEGQVAILSSGLLTADESLNLLQSLRQSALYRADQHSYILYPNRSLPGFLEKNHIPAQSIRDSKLVAALLKHHDPRLIRQGVNGDYHFNGDIRNGADVAHILESLSQETQYAEMVSTESDAFLTLFENLFNHAAFTGRSGTFFAYEGLGSIYWHMVSKLLLAVQETVLRTSSSGASDATLHALMDCYEDVRAGIGFNKPPDVYGAFPTDPYSHTPMGHGAKQPGMTGMVKEEILTRIVELGIVIDGGEIVFNPVLLRQQELLNVPSALRYVDVQGEFQQLAVDANCLAYTFCQIPVVVRRADENQIVVLFNDGTTQVIPGSRLRADLSQHIFARDGHIRQLTIHFVS